MTSRQFRVLFFFLTLTCWGCSEKEFDPEKPYESFIIAKEPYDDGNFDIAVKKLGEFKSRFPYSQFATEAELLIADSHYALEQYAEAGAAYSQFVKLHPKHAKKDYAQYRIGESFWADAPEEIDREQDLTAKAVEAWQQLIQAHPSSEYAVKAQELVKKGQRRIAESKSFIASFYCKQEIWHACAYRYMALAKTASPAFPDLVKIAYMRAAEAFEQLAKLEVDESKNLYFRDMSREKMREEAKRLKSQSEKM